MSEVNQLLAGCLYFSSNKLARTIGKIADEEFKKTGLSPTYAYLISVVNEKEGITQKEIAEILHSAPSTITRFIDKLENKGLLIRKNEGKNSFIYPTQEGKALQKEINKAWGTLHKNYLNILGEEKYKELTHMMNITCMRMEEK
jgi:DNA-binding MarR family transcriptional regulator